MAKKKEGENLQFSKEMGLILFDGYYEGGGTGKDGKPSPKVRLGTRKPKPYEIAKREYQWLLGKIKPAIVLTDYDDDSIFECRLKMAQALDQHCIAIKGAHKGGHIYWANSAQALSWETLTKWAHPDSRREGMEAMPRRTEIACWCFEGSPLYLEN